MRLRYPFAIELVVEWHNVVSQVAPLHTLLLYFVMHRQGVEPATDAAVVAGPGFDDGVVRVHVGFADLAADDAFVTETDLGDVRECQVFARSVGFENEAEKDAFVSV